MQSFLSQNSENNRLELLVDSTIFPSAVAMKAAYGLLDRAYFFFHTKDGNLLVQIQSKEWQDWNAEKFALEYSDELLATLLRDTLEQENKTIREAIVGAAIGNSLDTRGFVSLDTDRKNDGNMNNNQIDFDKDIDEILREIENDPELKIDEAEIERILKEIEEETQTELTEKPTLTLDPNKVKNAKEKFQSGK